ncbi:MAG: patatin-like phospholipase family protein [Candidatus Woesearchaeota archaeon]
MEQNKKIGLVVEGGAMRGIFSAGVLDAFIKNQFNPFDLCIGVSAGANNISSYLAEMYKRSYKVYTEYNLRKEFISWKKYLTGGHFLDLDWVWDTTIKELPMDKKKIISSKSNFYIGVTEVKTGKIKYIKPNEKNIEVVLKASCCVPGMYRNFVEIGEELYADGGIADPIPVKEAINQGADLIVVLRSRPSSYMMKQKRIFLKNILFRKHQNLKYSIMNRHFIYQETIKFMRNKNDIHIIEVTPPKSFKTKALTRNVAILKKDYKNGFNRGLILIDEIKEYVNKKILTK